MNSVVLEPQTLKIKDILRFNVEVIIECVKAVYLVTDEKAGLKREPSDISEIE